MISNDELGRVLSNDELARVLLALEHDRMERDTDLLYQSACAWLAPRVADAGIGAQLERAALTCHHCGNGDAA